MIPTAENLLHRRVILPGFYVEPVVIEAVLGLDDEVADLRVRTAQGTTAEVAVPTEILQAALADAAVADEAAYVDPQHQFLMIESQRIRLAYTFDPFFAVSLSSIDPLPHQLEAVYQHMLPQPRLRFLLADDPGAGKTIMAGLLLKELELRGAVERVLIVAPAPLTYQWQDEMRSKFDTLFERIESTAVKDQLAGSPWQRHTHCVTSMDFAKRPEVRSDLLAAQWDMVIIDEAHKVACADLSDQTDRYRLARGLAEKSERVLLLTATPHNGNQEHFRNLLALLDPDVFRDPDQARAVVVDPESPWLLRRAKEQLRGFDGRPLFVQRHAYSREFALSEIEYLLYVRVGQYIQAYLPKQQGKRKASAQLARTVLQRRVASSLYAIERSLQRRLDKLVALLTELEKAPAHLRMEILSKRLNLQVTDNDVDDDDRQEELFDAAASEVFLWDRWEQLTDERAELVSLLAVVQAAKANGQETKLQRLFRLLDEVKFADLEGGKARLLIFTEHKDTLDYLMDQLRGRGLRCVAIHGGMNALDRRQAQKDFRETQQVLVATDAAGEGINLQFCHLMINYDLPWNPVRLEQRLGRIHRYGQDTDVSVYNFVATSGPAGPDREPVVEGKILARLLQKLDAIRDNLGQDRVFDVVGMLLRLHNIDLEDVLREAVFNPKTLADYQDKIEKLSDEAWTRHEQATGIALATRNVNLDPVRGKQLDHEERRLMPEYVENWFVQAAEQVGLDVKRRQANKKLLYLEHVKSRFRSHTLRSNARHGAPETIYPKVSFSKGELVGDHQDGQLLSPIHPLYAAVEEVLHLDLHHALGGSAIWLDPRDRDPYRLYVFEVEVVGESRGDPTQPARTLPIHIELIALQQRMDGSLVRLGPDVLLDLAPGQVSDLEALGQGLSSPSPEEVGKAVRWVRTKTQMELVAEQRSVRKREVEIRRRYLEDAFSALKARRHQEQMRALARTQTDPGARITYEKAKAELDQLTATEARKLGELKYLEILRGGRIVHQGTALVVPTRTAVQAADCNDPAVELAAYEVVKQYEQAQGRVPVEVWKRHDGCGFDLRSVGPEKDGQREIRRIEVKGRAPAVGEVVLTPNERRIAERHGDSYWLYVVWGATSSAPRLKCIRNPVATLGAGLEEVLEVRYHRAAADALEAAAGEVVVWEQGGRE